MGKNSTPTRIQRGYLNLAGEYRVCSELQKREIFATITYGQHKGIDIFAIDDRLNVSLRIEVKASQKSKFVTGISQKKHDAPGQAPDIWVLVLMKQTSQDVFLERFFVLTHAEICKAQRKVNAKYTRKYVRRHGKEPNTAAGVDNIPLSAVEKYENQWEKLRSALVSQSHAKVGSLD